jgi:ankyrin repeat protein
LLDAEPGLLGEKDSSHRWPLEVAAEEGHLGVVKLMVQRAEDIKEPVASRSRLDTWGVGETEALYQAAAGGHAEIVAFLLSKGVLADIRTSNRRPFYNRGDKPLSAALKAGHLNVVQLLVQHLGNRAQKELKEQRWTQLMQASASGQLPVETVRPHNKKGPSKARRCRGWS